MGTSESAYNQDPSLYCAFFGGPRDGFLTGDLPAELSSRKLTGMTMQIPLGEDGPNGLVAVYQCTSDEQVDGFWRFDYVEVVPSDEDAAASGIDSSSIAESTLNQPGDEASPHLLRAEVHLRPDTRASAHHFAGPTKKHPAPAVWQSKVRGLMLGIALGDALGALGEIIPASGQLIGGAASQLAAWTADGLLRRTTRYGLQSPDPDHKSWPFITTHVRHADQRWLSMRSGEDDSFVPEALIRDHPGWLSHVPELAEKRGHSPSMEAAIRSGLPTRSNSCRPMIRALPVAILAGTGRFTRSTAAQAGAAAAEIARITHNHPGVEASSFTAALIAVSCLREPERFDVALDRSLREVEELGSLTTLPIAIELGRSRPGDPHTLREIAPDDTAESVLAGAIYVGSSYPDWQSANQALALARMAPDGDGVAALTGAFLGAVHGYEVFPAALLNRLELGWTLDRLAIDLALEVKEDQVPTGGWKEGGSPWLEPWWDAKYPGH